MSSDAASGVHNSRDDDEHADDRTGLLEGRRTHLAEDRPPSCMGHVADAVGAALSTTLHYTRMPADALLSCLWHCIGRRNNSQSDPTDRSGTPRADDDVDASPTARRIVQSPHTATRAQAAGVSVDASNSPVYSAFHPGQGYEAVGLDTNANRSHVVGPSRLTPPPIARRRDVEVKQPPADVCVAADVADHSPIYTAHELQRRIQAVASWLPVTIRVEATSSTTAAGGRHDDVQALSVIIVGPIRRPQRVASMRAAATDVPPPSLSDVEDYILEDTDACMLVASVQLMDLTFTATDYTRSEALTGSPSALRFDDDEDEPLEVHKARVVGMYQNLVSAVVERRGQPWGLRLAFVRCSMAPIDLLDSLRLPAAGFVECLTFEKCPLADAHVAALLRRARQDEHFFGHLRSLRLSGTLSPDAVRALLRYVDEEVEQPVLSELVVPSSCLGVALGHSIAVRLPHLLVNGKSIQRTEPHHRHQPA